MHIKYQKFWIYLTFIILLIFNIISSIALYYGKLAINESDEFLAHSNNITKSTNDLRISFDSAEVAGRLAISGINGNLDHLNESRQIIKDKLKILKDSIENEENKLEIQQLEKNINDRFTTQDKTFNSRKFILTKQGKFLQIPVELSLESNENLSKIIISFHRIRENNSNLLFEKTRSNVEVRKILWKWFLITIVGNFVGIILFSMTSIRDTGVRISASINLKEESEKNIASSDKLKEISDLLSQENE